MLKDTIEEFSLGDLPWLIITTYFGFYSAFIVHEFGHYFVARLFGKRPLRLFVDGWCNVCFRKYAGTLFVIPLILNPVGRSYVKLPYAPIGRFAVVSILFGGPVTMLLIGLLFILAGSVLESKEAFLIGLISIWTGSLQFIPPGTDGKRIWYALRYWNS